MPKQLPLSHVVVLTSDLDVEQRLGRLLSVLADLDVKITTVSESLDVCEELRRTGFGTVQCALIDASADDGDRTSNRFLDQIATLAAADIEPVVITCSPDPKTILAAFRAGAGDLIDLDGESDDRVLAILQRTAVTHLRRAQRRRRVRNFRVIVDGLFKNLILTERRTIDLEHLLAMRDESDVPEDFLSDRQAIVLVVDDDPEVAETFVELLGAADLEAHACGCGEEAVAYVRQMAQQGKALDMAIMDIHMPGMSGLDAVREMRRVKPHLAAMFMTGHSDAETAIDAADLGVVGYVIKPFDDTPKLIERIRDHAIESMSDARGRYYLEQIKQRHSKVLLRYQRLAEDLEELVA